MRRSLKSLLLGPGSLCLATLFACSPGDSAHLGSWRRTDLWQTAPRVEQVPPQSRWEVPWRWILGPLGSADVRADRSAPEPPIPAPSIRVLEQGFGSRLAFPLEIGSDAYFSFVPLGVDQGVCECAYRVRVRDASGQLHALALVQARPRSDPAPMVETVDLDAFDGQRVEIVLDVVPTGALVGALSTVAWGSPALTDRSPSPPAAPRSSRPNVILVGADTLRSDVLGAYGRQPSPTPALDQLASESDLWLEAFSTFNVTNPSFASIMTGLYGKNHGVYGVFTPLGEGHTTLAELFSAAGYETFAALSVNHLGPRLSGLGQGFGSVLQSPREFAAEVAVDATIEWIAERPGPFFAWVHLFDPHHPHAPPQPYALGFRPRATPGMGPVDGWLPFRRVGMPPLAPHGPPGHPDLYLGEVAYLDRQIGRLLDFLASRRLLENTIVVFVGDHGENLGEHGFYAHHAGLWDTTTHVPLMIRWPGREARGRRIEGLVQTLDLFPTLLAAVGLPVPEQDGLDLLELAGKGRSAVFSEHANRRGASMRTRSHRSSTMNGHRRIPDGNYFYDLVADPDELQNLAQARPEEARAMAQALSSWRMHRRPGAAPAGEAELSDQEREQLKALGYL